MGVGGGGAGVRRCDWWVRVQAEVVTRGAFGSAGALLAWLEERNAALGTPRAPGRAASGPPPRRAAAAPGGSRTTGRVPVNARAGPAASTGPHAARGRRARDGCRRGGGSGFGLIVTRRIADGAAARVRGVTAGRAGSGDSRLGVGAPAAHAVRLARQGPRQGSRTGAGGLGHGPRGWWRPRGSGAVERGGVVEGPAGPVGRCAGCGGARCTRGLNGTGGGAGWGRASSWGWSGTGSRTPPCPPLPPSRPPLPLTPARPPAGPTTSEAASRARRSACRACRGSCRDRQGPMLSPCLSQHAPSPSLQPLLHSRPEPSRSLDDAMPARPCHAPARLRVSPARRARAAAVRRHAGPRGRRQRCSTLPAGRMRSSEPPARDVRPAKVAAAIRHAAPHA